MEKEKDDNIYFIWKKEEKKREIAARLLFENE